MKTKTHPKLDAFFRSAKENAQAGMRFIIENGDTIANAIVFVVACVRAFSEADKRPKK